MRLCQTLAWRGGEFREFAASHRLVHTESHPAWAAFYWFGWLLFHRSGLGFRILLATLVEVAWEISENTDAVIQHYQEATIALDYFGDSVLNSVADCAAMLAGFFLTRILPVWASIALFILEEAIVIYFIRDGLLLNILMLLWPLEAVKGWQQRG